MEIKFSPEKFNYKNDNHSLCKNKKINLIPSPVIRLNQSTYNSFKKREPKLVLYEPYKAAVKPIIPVTNQKIIRERKKKNNLDCNELISHILLVSNSELSLQKGIPITGIRPSTKTKDVSKDVIKSDSEKQELMSEVCFSEIYN